MNKRDQIDYILALVKAQTEEFMDIEESHSSIDLSPEEMVVAAIEIITSHPVTKMEYVPLIGRIDRSKVSFVIDDELEIPLYEESSDDDTSM